MSQKHQLYSIILKIFGNLKITQKGLKTGLEGHRDVTTASEGGSEPQIRRIRSSEIKTLKSSLYSKESKNRKLAAVGLLMMASTHPETLQITSEGAQKFQKSAWIALTKNRILEDLELVADPMLRQMDKKGRESPQSATHSSQKFKYSLDLTGFDKRPKNSKNQKNSEKSRKLSFGQESTDGLITSGLTSHNTSQESSSMAICNESMEKASLNAEDPQNGPKHSENAENPLNGVKSSKFPFRLFFHKKAYIKARRVLIEMEVGSRGRELEFGETKELCIEDLAKIFEIGGFLPDPVKYLIWVNFDKKGDNGMEKGKEGLPGAQNNQVKGDFKGRGSKNQRNRFASLPGFQAKKQPFDDQEGSNLGGGGFRRPPLVRREAKGGYSLPQKSRKNSSEKDSENPPKRPEKRSRRVRGSSLGPGNTSNTQKVPKNEILRRVKKPIKVKNGAYQSLFVSSPNTFEPNQSLGGVSSLLRSSVKSGADTADFFRKTKKSVKIKTLKFSRGRRMMGTFTPPPPSNFNQAENQNSVQKKKNGILSFGVISEASCSSISNNSIFGGQVDAEEVSVSSNSRNFGGNGRECSIKKRVGLRPVRRVLDVSVGMRGLNGPQLTGLACLRTKIAKKPKFKIWANLGFLGARTTRICYESVILGLERGRGG